MRRLVVYLAFFVGLSSAASIAAVAPGAKSLAVDAVPSDQELNDALKALATRDPSRQKQLLDLRSTNPEAFSRAVLNVVKEERKLARLRATVPGNVPLQIAMWKNREKLRSFVEEYHAESDAGGKAIVSSQIENVLGEQYDLRREMRLNRIKALEAKLQAARRDFSAKSGSERSQFVSAWKPKLLANQKKAAQNN